VILYGRNPVREALRGRRARTVGEVWVSGGAVREPWLEGVAVRKVSAEELEGRCGSAAHQGVCAQAGGYPYVSADELFGEPDPLIVALDQVQDPQNLGSICRTAECAGATGVVIAERRAAEVTPAVCKASAGAVEHLCVARVRNVADFLLHARDAGCWSYGASAPLAGGSSRAGRVGEGSEASRVGDGSGRGRPAKGGAGGADATVPYDRPDYRGGVVLVLGSEGRGLRPRVAGACDQLISLPLLGRIESLGVSAAAAALLYDILQNRRRALDNAL
jgi:23S rRNA (guanosine2251-2'-O)-methyltransferase